MNTLGVEHHSAHLWIGPVILLLLVGVGLLVAYPRSKRNSVTVNLTVGETDKHTVTFFRNAWTGRVRITVDNIPVKNNIEWFAWKVEKKYEYAVGGSERHTVTFVRTRKKLVPAFRKWTVEALVDRHFVTAG